MQRVEPTACLVHPLGNEVRRKILFKPLHVVERVVHLCVRHGTRVEPDIDQVRLTEHLFTAFAHQHYLIHEGPVQVQAAVVLIREIARHKVRQRILLHEPRGNRFFYLVP